MRLRGSTRSRSLPSSQTEYSLWGRGRGARCGGHLHAILEPDRDLAVHVEGNHEGNQGQSRGQSRVRSRADHRRSRAMKGTREGTREGTPTPSLPVGKEAEGE